MNDEKRGKVNKRNMIKKCFIRIKNIIKITTLNNNKNYYYYQKYININKNNKKIVIKKTIELKTKYDISQA